MTEQNQTAVVARYTFRPERAAEFSEDGRQIVEMAFEDADEIYEFAVEFRDALEDVTVLVNGQVISLSDFAVEEN